MNILKDIFIITMLFATTIAIANHRVALVIGNGEYKTAPLDNPINDADAVADKLQNLGFEVIRGNNLDRKAMLKKVRDFRQQVNSNTEIALFYYAGHGAQYDKESYLIPLTASIDYDNDLPIEGISAQKILQQIEDENAKVNILILDACRNLPFKRRKRSGLRGLASISGNSQSLIVYSTKAGETANDNGKSGSHSPYTEVLLRYLDKPLPVTQLFNDIGYEVNRIYGQQPWISGSGIPRIYLRTPQKQVTHADTQSTQSILPVMPATESQNNDVLSAEEVKKIIQNYYDIQVSEDWRSLLEIYSDNITRFFDKRNITNYEAVEIAKNYKSKFGITQVNYDISWDSLVHKNSSLGTEVNYTMNYRIKRNNKNKPSYFLLNITINIDKNRKIISIYEDIMSKK